MTGVAGGVRERHSLGASVDGASGGGGKGHRAGGEKRMKKRPRPDRLGPTPVPTSYSPTVPTDWPTYSPTSLEGAPSKALRMIEREREKRRKREEEERAKAEGGRPGPRAGSSAPSLAPSPALAGEGSDGTIAASPSAPPSGAPSRSPSGTPSGRPSAEPSGAPAARPSAAPVPTTRPPTAPPTSGGCSSLNGSRCKKSHSCVLVRSGDGEEETHECLPRPTAGPTSAPSAVPTAVPTAIPTVVPTSGRPATPDGSARVGLTMDAPSIVVPTAPTPPPDGSSKVTLTLDPDEAKARGPSEFSLTTWGLEGADVAAKAGRGNPGGRHGGRPKSERNGSGFSLAAGSLGGSGGDTTSSGDGEGDGEKNKAADGASKVNLSLSAAAGDAAVAESDPGKKVSLSFSLPSDDSPVPTAGPSGEPTYLLFPTYGPSSAPRKKSKKDKKDKDKDKEEEEEEEEVDTDSPTSWPTTYLPTYLPTSPIGDALDPRKRFDPLSSGDVSPEDREGAGTDHRGKHPTDLSSLYERRACPTSPRARASPRGVGGGAIPVERTVERTVEFAYALQSAGSGEDAAETVQLHLLEDVALGLLGCHARVSSARSAGGGGGATAWAEEVWYERDASVASMHECTPTAPGADSCAVVRAALHISTRPEMADGARSRALSVARTRLDAGSYDSPDGGAVVDTAYLGPDPDYPAAPPGGTAAASVRSTGGGEGGGARAALFYAAVGTAGAALLAAAAYVVARRRARRERRRGSRAAARSGGAECQVRTSLLPPGAPSGRGFM